MGVMSCCRKNCENIMCNTYVDNIGYICYECQEEFKLYLERKNSIPANEYEIKYALTEFVAEPKGKYCSDEAISIDEFFQKYSKD